ncbi:MAG: hypothetical protein PUC06_01070 [Oscillospiraceae bacterium]|nr:hypothetical protein [Oscillospiraceae bacterium]
MGCWGMGITQSDEYCEVYERFMERYNNGDAVSEITNDILKAYHSEFSDDDEILHDVYFALAKAEWMCCSQSKNILAKVHEIIESGANIRFYRGLEATETDLKLRQKNLEKFWTSLQTPRAKPRQRRIDPLDRFKELPPVQPGECYAYRHEDGYRVLVILDRFKEPVLLEQICVCVLKDTFATPQVQVETEKIAYIANYIGVDFLGMSSLHKLPSINLDPDFAKKIPANYISWHGEKKDFHKENTSALNISIADLKKKATSRKEC